MALCALWRRADSPGCTSFPLLLYAVQPLPQGAPPRSFGERRASCTVVEVEQTPALLRCPVLENCMAYGSKKAKRFSLHAQIGHRKGVTRRCP